MTRYPQGRSLPLWVDIPPKLRLHPVCLLLLSLIGMLSLAHSADAALTVSCSPADNVLFGQPTVWQGAGSGGSGSFG